MLPSNSNYLKQLDKYKENLLNIKIKSNQNKSAINSPTRPITMSDSK